MRAYVVTRQMQRIHAGDVQILMQSAREAIGDHVNRSFHRIGCDRHAARHCFSQHQSERVGTAGENEDVGAVVIRRQFIMALGPEETNLRITLLQLLALRSVADYPFGTGQIELEEGFDVFFHGDTADVQEQRAHDAGVIFRRRFEVLGIDATAPQGYVTETMQLKRVFHLRRRHHDGLGRPMEPAHQAIRQCLGQQLACTQVFRKARMVRGGEIQLFLKAVAARREAHRAFSRDMNAVWLERIQRGGDLGIRLVGQPYLGVSRAGKCAEIARCQHEYFVTFVSQAIGSRPQGVDYAIDLGLARVAYDGNAHKSSTPASLVLFFNCMISPQVTRRNSPEGSSTRADRLSTQSPSLQYMMPLMSRISGLWICPQITPSRPFLEASAARASSNEVM